MLSNFNKKIELIANLTIIIVASLLAVVLIKDHLLTRAPVGASRSVSQPRESENQTANGTNLSSLDVDWKQSKQTLVLAISSTCHFCSESAPFYRKLAQQKRNTRLVAVLPQSEADGQEYLSKLGVSVDEVRQLPLDKIGVRGTPTLFLVDDSGVVRNSWEGKLAAEQEADVLSTVLTILTSR